MATYICVNMLKYNPNTIPLIYTAILIGYLLMKRIQLYDLGYIR